MFNVHRTWYYGKNWNWKASTPTDERAESLIQELENYHERKVILEQNNYDSITIYVTEQSYFLNVITEDTNGQISGDMYLGKSLDEVVSFINTNYSHRLDGEITREHI